jgi:hypothetical protein
MDYKQKHNIMITHLRLYLEERLRCNVDYQSGRGEELNLTYAQWVSRYNVTLHDRTQMTEDKYNLASTDRRNIWLCQPWCKYIPTRCPDDDCDIRILNIVNSDNPKLYQEYLAIILKSHNMTEEEWFDDH